MNALHSLALIGFVAVAWAADLSVGVGGGRVIFDQNATASPAIWRQIRNLTVNTSNDEVISQVVVIDNRPEKDGSAKVVEGGEGHKNVTIELQSPAVFRGFDFSIQVFAAPENVQAPAPIHPKATGVDTQNPQVPFSKDLDVNDNSKQVPKNGGDIIIGAPTPTAAPTTEANKDDQHKISNPALVGQEQTRLNRDTKDQKTEEQTPIPTLTVVPSEVAATKDVRPHENADSDLKNVNNSSQKSEDTVDSQTHPVVPQDGGEDLINLSEEEENRKVRQTKKEPVVPALPKELKGDEVSTTPKIEVSSTTAKNIGQDKLVPKLVPETSEVSSTTAANKLTTTTESSKLPENVKTTQDLEANLKGHHFGHHHAVPLPYVH